MAQFASMDARFENLGVVVQQAMEVLDDVKSRQARVDKAYQKQGQQGYLSIVTGMSVPPAEKVRCSAAQSLAAARRRSDADAEQHQKEVIRHAQDEAIIHRGRSIERRTSAAQRVASRSASRGSSVQ